MAKIFRFFTINLFTQPTAVITPGSEHPQFLASALLRSGLGDITRTKTGWVVRSGENDRIDFNRGGVKSATVAAGNYEDGATLCTAIVAALAAADATPAWSCTYSTTTHFFTISTAAHNFVLLFSTGTNKAKSLHLDISFISLDTASGLSATGSVESYQSRHVWHLDVGASSAVGWTITAGVNDSLDWFSSSAGSNLTATIPAGVYTIPSHLAAVVKAAISAVDTLSTWAVYYNNATKHFEFTTAPLGHILLTGTGAHLATTAWRDLGFNIGSDSTSATFHESDFAVVGSPYPPSTVAFMRNVNFSTQATVTFEGSNSTTIGAAYGTAQAFTTTLTIDTLRRSDVWLSVFSSQRYRYWRILVQDQSNSVPYATVGVMWLSDGASLGASAQPEQRNSDRTYEQLSDVLYAVEGAQHTVLRVRRQVFSFLLKVFTDVWEKFFTDLDFLYPPGVPFFICFDYGIDNANLMYGFTRAGLSLKMQSGNLRYVSFQFCEELP